MRCIFLYLLFFILSIQPAFAAQNKKYPLNLYDRLTILKCCICPHPEAPDSVKDNAKTLVYSPYGIKTAFAMASAGARGETYKEIAQFFGFSRDYHRLEREFNKLITSLNAINNEEIAFLNANSMWVQKGYKILQGYDNEIRSYFHSKVFLADFAGRPDAERIRINKWVEKKTKSLIKDLIAPDMIDPLTRLVLVNAVYLKAKWLNPFDKADTKKETFYKIGGEKEKIDMMHQTGFFKIKEFDKFSILEMPYKGERLSMFIILPKERNGLPEVEKGLTTPKLRKCIREVLSEKENNARITIPKFKAEGTYELKSDLFALKLILPFFQLADFSGITDAKGLFIKDVVHKAVLNVSEYGTEESDSPVIMKKAAAYKEPRQEYTYFTADHPFMFVVMDKETGEILFLGRFVQIENVFRLW